MPLQRLTVGEPFRGIHGDTWNTLCETADVKRRFDASPFNGETRIRWKNTSGSDAPRGAIVRPTALVAVESHLVIDGKKPDGTLRPIYGVSLDLVKDGSIGRLSFFEFGACHYYTSDGTPSFGESWGIEPSQWYLRKNRPGWTILGNPEGAGGQAVVKATSSPIVSIIGKLAGGLSQGSFATVNVWGGTGGSEAVVTGVTLTARDWFLASGADAIPSGSKVKCDLINGVWYVTQAECPAA